MRVLMLGHEWFTDHPGGGGRYLADVARGLAARGHAVTVVVPRHTAEPPADEVVEGVALRRLDLRGGAAGWIAGFWRAVPGLVRDHGPFDVVHSHFALTGLAPLWNPALAGARRVTQFQGPWPDESAVEGGGRANAAAKRLLERLAYRRCHAFITLSAAFREVLAEGYGVDRAMIRVVPAAVDVERFRLPEDRAALRAGMGLGDGPVVFVMRRLVKRMGLEVMLEAWERVQAVVPDARLLIGGSGPLRDALEAQVRALGIGASVRFLGRIDDDALVSAYQAADLTVVPTLALEGFGLVTVESLACGTPVVGTTAGATPEILGPLDPRLLVPPGDAAALADRLVSLLAAPGARPDADRCRAHVMAHYTWPGILAALEAVLAGG